MKNVLFVALLSAFTLVNAQFSYAHPDDTSSDHCVSKVTHPMPTPNFTSDRRVQGGWVPQAPMKPASAQLAYWTEKAIRDGGQTVRVENGQLWLRNR